MVRYAEHMEDYLQGSLSNLCGKVIFDDNKRKFTESGDIIE